jgi:hypothetical protein
MNPQQRNIPFIINNNNNNNKNNLVFQRSTRVDIGLAIIITVGKVQNETLQ